MFASSHFAACEKSTGFNETAFLIGSGTAQRQKLRCSTHWQDLGKKTSMKFPMSVRSFSFDHQAGADGQEALQFSTLKCCQKRSMSLF